MAKLRNMALKAAVFTAVLWMTVGCVNKILTPKYFFNETWPTTSTYTGFYKMEKNTVDVLFFGSSHAASSFNPQVLYNSYGITSYNLGCEQQNLVTSYYWLKEALRYQKPKAVILDCYILFPYRKEEPLNTAESCTRKALDYMKWSPVKWEAIQAVCSADKNQTLSSYCFPNIRFHTRWNELNEEDFTFSQMSAHYELKGFTAIPRYSGFKNYRPFSAGDSQEEEPMVALMEEYLEKITALCREQNISLLLVKTPCTSEDVKKYNRLNRYAAEHDLVFIDFNEKDVYRKSGYQFHTDNCDEGHGSIWGAAKITVYVGDVLRRVCGLEKRQDSQWEKTAQYYQGIIKDCTLHKVTDMGSYLDLIRDDRYWILIAVRDEGVQALEPDILAKLRALGFQAELEGQIRCSYYGIAAEGSVTEELGYRKLTAAGTFRGGKSVYEIVSAGYEVGNLCSIVIDEKEYAKNKRGINIVVYNPVTKAVVDSVCFDTHEPGAVGIR